MLERPVARLVYAGSDVVVPPEMGVPRADQLCSTPMENLSELAGRVCYDSCGTGRPTVSADGKEGFHEHILKVGHFSIYEHAHFVISIRFASEAELLAALIPAVRNRPGVLFSCGIEQFTLRLCLNLRHVLDWGSAYHRKQTNSGGVDHGLSRFLAAAVHPLAPNVFAADITVPEPAAALTGVAYRFGRPQCDYERWISLYLKCSRNCGYEQVRHGDFTAISQRSTRFVDESESPYIWHPLARRYFEQTGKLDSDLMGKDHYRRLLNELGAAELFNADHPNVTGAQLKKQLRGAARGVLGGALQTEMIFSANVPQWRHMLRMRGSIFADAEIRELYVGENADSPCVLAALKASAYGDRFSDLNTVASPDGFGLCLAE